MFRFFASLLLIPLSGTAMSASDPDFSGCWRLDSAESETRALPAPPPALIHIEHRNHSIRCLDAQTHQDLGWTFTTDGKETRTQTGGATSSSIAKWEGSALLINTLVNSSAAGYTQMDRWKLSRDGAHFTLRREIVRSRGASQSTLVYVREACAGEPAPARR